MHNLVNIFSTLQTSKRESVVFSVGFSPVSNKKSLRRQQGFIQKQPQSSSQVSILVNKFENKDNSSSFGGETPVQSWRAWVKGDSTGRRSCQLDSDSKFDGKINKNLANSFKAFQNGVSDSVNDTEGKTVENMADSCNMLVNDQTEGKTNSQGKPPLNIEDNFSKQTSSVKRRHRSASFKSFLCGVKRVKVDDTCEELETGSYSGVSGSNIKENTAEEPFVRGESLRRSVRRSLKENFFLMDDGKDSPVVTGPAKATSASQLPPKPTPVIKSVKSDSMVTSILKQNLGVSNIGQNIKSELLPPIADLSNKFASPSRDLDVMFTVMPSPAFAGSTPAKVPPEQPSTPNLAKQFNVLSIYNNHSPFRDSPRMDKKPSKSLLPWKKKSSSSTSRFQGTPVKIKFTPSVSKEFKSCSDLGGKEPIHPPTPVGTTYKLTPYPIGRPSFSSTPAPSSSSGQQAMGPDASISEEIGAVMLTPSRRTPKKSVSKLFSKLTPKRRRVRPLENFDDECF